ncbi:hypothetical protein [Streptomyces sp. NPDC048825]|uniref:hypothetical protein n=1 Tax=Streptomyces sp. NPDC048825 TaxID=3365592 RepID=UPI003714E16F
MPVGRARLAREVGELLPLLVVGAAVRLLPSGVQVAVVEKRVDQYGPAVPAAALLEVSSRRVAGSVELPALQGAAEQLHEHPGGVVGNSIRETLGRVVEDIIPNGSTERRRHAKSTSPDVVMRRSRVD